MLRVTTSVSARGQQLVLEKVLASGGEGKIWSVQGHPQQFAKIYRAPTKEHEAKLKIMLASPPRDPGRSMGHISLAWPQELLFDPNGNCKGFLMPAIDRVCYVPLFKAYVPDKRLQLPEGFTWEYLLRVASNIASVVSALHLRGYVLGDVLNESNVLCNYRTALICLVDCDSLQVPRPEGGVYRCPVGKSEFTSPELQGGHFKQIDRRDTHDNFALAVLIFLLLMQGKHPFDGVPQGSMPDLSLEERIRAGYCAYAGTADFVPPPDAPPLSVLTPRLHYLLRRCFVDGHHDPARRPSSKEWYQALFEAEQQIITCATSDLHMYLRPVLQCPWCEIVQRGYPDPFVVVPMPYVVSASRPLSSITGVHTSSNVGVVSPLQASRSAQWSGIQTTPQAVIAPLPGQTYTHNPLVRRGFPSSMLIMLLIVSPIICAIAAVLLYYVEVVIRALLHTR